MTLLERLGRQLPERFYLGVDVGYKEHVAVVISLQTFARGDERWKRARCTHVPSTQRGLKKLQRYLDRFSADPDAYLGLCEPTGGYYGATLYRYLLDRGYPMMWVDNLTVKHMREKIFRHLPKTDEVDARVMARIAYLHEAVGEEFTLRPLELPDADDSDLLAMCRDHWRLNTVVCRARNQFSQLMAVTFPELKTFFISSVSTPAPVRLMAAFPTPADLAAAAPEAVRDILHKARAHEHAERVPELQELARTSSGLMPDPGRAWRLAWLTDFLLSNLSTLTALEKQIEERVVRREDYHLLAELPYSGPVTLASILTATGDAHRFRNHRQYVAYTGYFAGLQTSQTIDRTRMSKRGNRLLKRALFQIAAPLVWFDRGENPYKELYRRRVGQGRGWYAAMPFVCAAVARHIYHCLKFDDPYDVEKAFRGSAPTPALEEAWADLGTNLDERFEVMEDHVWQLVG
jgi:transposase